MPIHPGMVEVLAAGTRDLYAGAEERLLALIARQLGQGLDAPGWAEQKLSAIQQMRRAAQAVVTELDRAAALEVFEAVADAYNAGHRAAAVELGAVDDDTRRQVDDVLPQAQAVDRLAQETVDVVTATHRGILRAVDDGYRRVVAEVASTPLLGTGTRRHATQDAMRRWADRGVTSFTDRSGRRWALTSYAEMAVRTAVGRAATEAHTRTLTEHGVDLVVVSDSPRECPLCRRWERKILTIGGPPGARTIEVEHATRDGEMLPVRVAGSLDEARRAGLQHPNCRHSTSAYTPGITRTDDARPDPEGYEAGQRQREIERHIRRHKNRAAAAVDPAAKRAATAKVRAWQKAQRDHLAEHPQLRRNPARERIGAGNLPDAPSSPTPAGLATARVWSGDERTLGEMPTEAIEAAVRSGRLDARGMHRAADELDRRDPVPMPTPAATGDPVADMLADRDALADAMSPMPDPDGWGRLADDADFAADAAALAAAAEQSGESTDERHTITRREARELYDEYVYRQFLAAEADLSGYLLTKKAAAAGHAPVGLFSGPARIAYARASDELKAWWAQHGRLTQAEFIEQVTGQTQRWAAGARKNESDHQNRR
ncbi:phage minor capsid protein [Streptomyces sp. LE64]|uniref:phage minor capsid protein n=1 Tax=Streptomyces sp. LE64 TaxID=3448653 RepID=UPI004041F0AD